MNIAEFRKESMVVLLAILLATQPYLYADTGYMGFLSPTQTQVKTGDAASYMHAGTDWDGSTCFPNPCTDPTSSAVPDQLQQSTITTWRDGSFLHFKFVIPDHTTVTSPGGQTLACGDQVILQIGPANTADVTLQPTKEFRFEVVIQNNQITQQPGSVAKRLPNGGSWNVLADSTAATASLTPGGNAYNLTLDVPLSEINNPVGDIGLALALINDLGHSHLDAGNTVNEVTGTAFPIGMGLTPESDPYLSTCAQPAGETATGNWINPSTWGTGYASLATVAGDVTLSQSPNFYLSDSLRLGKCSVTNFGDIPAVSANNWVADQQNSPTWYLYNPAGPCRMGIWMNAFVAGTGIVKKRFLIVWGRPGISPVDWYFAGLTDPVALNGPNTVVSFVWNNVPAVNFSDHPCLRVYILPEVITPADQAFIDPLKNTGTSTDAALSAMEAHFAVAQGTNKSAQMNFDKIGTGGCTDRNCTSLSWLQTPPAVQTVPGFSLVTSAFAQPNPNQGTTGDGKRSPNLVRITTHAFSVAPPAKKKRYVFVEPIGGLGWAVPVDLVKKGNVPLNMEVAIPKVAAKMFVQGKAVEIPSTAARVYFAVKTDATPGTQIPKIDTSSLRKFSQEVMQPGQIQKAQIVAVKPCSKLGATALFSLPLGAALIGVGLYWPRKRKHTRKEGKDS